jgi:coenzyme PQQ precursor peptide PqqA
MVLLFNGGVKSVQFPRVMEMLVPDERAIPTKEIHSMKTWTRPDFQEVNLGCEINCYAPAEL